MIAVVAVREGQLPTGALETIAEAQGSVVLIGSGLDDAVEAVAGVARRIALIEAGEFQPAAWATTLAPLLLDYPAVVLPHSPDGRDLAPRLAAALNRDLLANASKVDEAIVSLPRGGKLHHIKVTKPFVATLQPGARSIPVAEDDPAEIEVVTLDPIALATTGDANLVELHPADPATVDLSEAPRLIGGGAGLGSAEAFDEMAELARLMGASTGGTRVVMDWGWIPFERQIGTTGIIVNPDLYMALGVSGAVQHTAGLGSPDHVISVNTDPHCPMMDLADLALVTDAPLFLTALRTRLEARSAEGLGSGDGVSGEVS